MAKSPNLIARGARPSAMAVGADDTPKKPFNLVQFLREVRAEGRKVTWTNWRETWITSAMVAVMVILTALFFFAVDEVLAVAMHYVLRLANAE
jgi:preprotein translocase subunit SecE